MKKLLIYLSLTLLWINQSGSFAISSSILVTNNPDQPVILASPSQPNPNSTIQNFLAQNKIRTLDDYIHWQATHLHYIKDAPDDNWAAPEETIKKGGGDCEDLSFLHAAVLKYFGYEPRVLAQGIAKQAHVFCMFKRNGKLSVFDNINYVDTQLTNFDQVNNYLKQNIHNDYLLELTLKPKSYKLLYENTLQLTRKNPG